MAKRKKTAAKKPPVDEDFGADLREPGEPAPEPTPPAEDATALDIPAPPVQPVTCEDCGAPRRRLRDFQSRRDGRTLCAVCAPRTPDAPNGGE